MRGKKRSSIRVPETKIQNGVAYIITFGKLKARMVLRDVGRVLGLSYGHVDRICKMVPFDPSRPLTLQESLIESHDLKRKLKTMLKLKNFGTLIKTRGS